MNGSGRLAAGALCLAAFIALATLNVGGYRYGASDQAFYVPAVLLQLDPTLFPRDAAVLQAQTHLTLSDELMARLAPFFGGSLPLACAVLYVISLTIFAIAAWRIGRRLYGSPWTALALVAAFTMRHAIARSGTNTFEGYFQPRLLVYALGMAALDSVLRGRLWMAALLLVPAAAFHPPTTVWFALWLGCAAAIANPSLRAWLMGAGVLGAAVAIWALTAGPLAGRLAAMDADWLRMLETKDYLFPLEWPAYAWCFNLGYLAVIAWVFRRRTALGLVDARERGVILGSSVLFVVFVTALIGQLAGIALAYQAQAARVFWMFDFLAVAYAVWALAEWHPPARVIPRRARAAAVTIAALSLIRGAYVLIETERPLVQVTIPDDDWGRVMRWAKATDKRSGWLADPLHAVLYGTSVRLAAERDVYVEAIKDAALGMYDRSIAVRTDERLRELGEFNQLTSEGARRIGRSYDLDYMVTEMILDLPLAFESGPLHVYRLR